MPGFDFEIPRFYNNNRPRLFFLSRNWHRLFTWLWNSYIHKMEWGLLPKEYNKKIHGPYYPWRNYGPQEKRLLDQKLSELPAYLARRKKSPTAVVKEAGRLGWWWQYRFHLARYNGMNRMYHASCFITLYGLFEYSHRIVMHTEYRYHW